MPSHQVFVAVDLHASTGQAFHEFTSFAWLDRNAVLFDVQPRALGVGANVVLSFRGASSASHVTTRISRFVPDQQIAFHYANSVDVLRATVLHFCFEVFGVAACRLVVVKQTAGIFYNAFDEFAQERARLLELAMGFKHAVDARYNQRVMTGFVSGSADGVVAQVAPPQWRYSASAKCHQCKAPISDTLTSVVNKTDRQTHCRACGRQFCGDCCNKRIVVPTFALSNEPQKVCSMCFRDLSADLESNEAEKEENMALIEAMRREVEAQVAAQADASPAPVSWSQVRFLDDDDDDDDDDKADDNGKRPVNSAVAPAATVAAPATGSRWRETNLFVTDEEDAIAVMAAQDARSNDVGDGDDVIAALLSRSEKAK